MKINFLTFTIYVLPANRCGGKNPTHEVGIIEGGVKNSFEANIRYYDNMINSEQRLKFLNPVPTTDFKVFVKMKKVVDSADNVTATGYVTLPELRIGKI